MTDRSATSRARCARTFVAVAAALLGMPTLVSTITASAGAGSVELNPAYGNQYQLHDGTAFGPKLTEMLAPFAPVVDLAASKSGAPSNAHAASNAEPESAFRDSKQDAATSGGNLHKAGFVFRSGAVRQAASAPQAATGWKWEPFFPQAQAAVTYGSTAADSTAAAFGSEQPAYPPLSAETLLSAELTTDRFGAVRYRFTDTEVGRSGDAAGSGTESSLPGVMWIFLSGLFLLAILRRRQDDAPNEV